MPVKEGGSAEGEDEDRMSRSADSGRGYPKMGRAACRGLQMVLEMHKEGSQSSPGGLRTDLSIIGLH